MGFLMIYLIGVVLAAGGCYYWDWNDYQKGVRFDSNDFALRVVISLSSWIGVVIIAGLTVYELGGNLGITAEKTNNFLFNRFNKKGDEEQ